MVVAVVVVVGQRLLDNREVLEAVDMLVIKVQGQMLVQLTQVVEEVLKKVGAILRAMALEVRAKLS